MRWLWFLVQVPIIGGLLWLWAADGSGDRPPFGIVFGIALGLAFVLTLLLTAWIEIGKGLARRIKARSGRNPADEVARSQMPQVRPSGSPSLRR